MTLRGQTRHEARRVIEDRLLDERGTLGRGGPAPICLVYPSPYRVGMSSLGFQTLYRRLNAEGPGCHRAFLPDEWEPQVMPWPPPRAPILSYEALRPISEYPLLGVSVAYELEVVGLLRLLEGAGIPVLAADRGLGDPIVLAGGPLTTTNASVLLPFVDLLLAGEGEQELPLAVERIMGASGRSAAVAAAVASPHVCAGEITPGHSEPLPTMASCDRALLPAYSAITTPHTELSDMFLVEPERGCSRQCTFCVMRGPSTGGMRLLDAAVPLSLVPAHAKRVGLVGAAVTDHPKLEHLVGGLVDAGYGVGISSLRADRLTPELVRNLGRGGYSQITVASDGISERLRQQLLRKISSDDLRRAAQLVRADPGMRGLKIYQMIGVPSQTDDDIDELIEFCHELAALCSITLTFSTFVAKRNTPLDGQPFVGVRPAERALRKISAALRQRIKIRPQSPRWAHIEYLLAQRGPEGGHATLAAVREGGGYRAFVDAFAALPPPSRELRFGDEERLRKRTGHAAGRRHPQLAVVREPS